MLYLISYDLRVPGQDYPNLTQALTKAGAKRVLLSQWLYPTNTDSAMDILNHFGQFLDATDRMLVTEVTTKSAWRNARLDKATMDALFAYARS